MEVNYLTAYSCQFLFHFASNAKLSDLSGILITMIRERDVSFNFPSYLSIERIFYSLSYSYVSNKFTSNIWSRIHLLISIKCICICSLSPKKCPIIIDYFPCGKRICLEVVISLKKLCTNVRPEK